MTIQRAMEYPHELCCMILFLIEDDSSIKKAQL